MSKKRKTTVAKDLVSGMKSFTKQLKSGKPIKGTRMHKLEGMAFFDGYGQLRFFTTDIPLNRGWRPVTIFYSEPVTLSRKAK